jgi:EpsI family protein
MIGRIVALSGALLFGVAMVATTSRTEIVPVRQSFEGFPMTLPGWTGMDEGAFAPEILEVLGVDDYLNRRYRTGQGSVGLYVGFYESQRQGDTIHSPMNCIPGAGWSPLSRTYLPIAVASADGGERQISVNQYVIEKALDRQVVLYWYQSRGRVIASEYVSKVSMVLDAVRFNRTDAALVRIVSPVVGHGPAAEAAALSLATDFVQRAFPVLEQYLPS